MSTQGKNLLAYRCFTFHLECMWTADEQNVACSHSNSDRLTCSALQACSHPPSSFLLTLTTLWPTQTISLVQKVVFLFACVAWPVAVSVFVSCLGQQLSFCLEYSATQRYTAHQTLHKYSGRSGLWTSPSLLHCITHWTVEEKFRLPALTQWPYCSVISPVSKSLQCIVERDAGCADDCMRNEIMNHLATASTTTWDIYLSY